jgi:hypothetical protein
MLLIQSSDPVQSSFSNPLYVMSCCHFWIKRSGSYINRSFLLCYSRGRRLRWTPAGPNGPNLTLANSTGGAAPNPPCCGTVAGCLCDSHPLTRRAFCRPPGHISVHPALGMGRPHGQSYPDDLTWCCCLVPRSHHFYYLVGLRGWRAGNMRQVSCAGSDL